jgi:hypothetical protein
VTIDVETVCTDADLETHTLGKNNLQKLLPNEWLADPDQPYHAETNVKSTLIPRQHVLGEVLEHLRKRRPPIYETDLADVTQLKTVVSYGSLAVIYGGAEQYEDSPNAERAKRFQKKYADELSGLQPDVIAGATTSSLSVRISRG